MFGLSELLVAAATDVPERLTLLEGVFVRRGLGTTGSIVELHTNLVGAHVGLRDPVDILIALTAGGGPWGDHLRPA